MHKLILSYCAYRPLGILLKCRLWLSGSGVGHGTLHSNSSRMRLRLLVGGPSLEKQRV